MPPLQPLQPPSGECRIVPTTANRQNEAQADISPCMRIGSDNRVPQVTATQGYSIYLSISRHEKAKKQGWQLQMVKEATAHALDYNVAIQLASCMSGFQ